MQPGSFKNIANAYNIIISEKHEIHTCFKTCLCHHVANNNVLNTNNFYVVWVLFFQYGVLHNYQVALLCIIQKFFMNISKIADFMQLS